MSKLREQAAQQDLFVSGQRRIFSVSEITRDIKALLEGTFSDIWVEGEISNFKAYPSGHFYFTLKDDKSAINAVIFGAANNRGIKFKPEDGLNVICLGKISAYGPRSQYQIRVERIEPKGVGGLQLAFGQLKNKLEAEGLFSLEHKKPIPELPLRVGVVTSGEGAAIRDILSTLKRRAPFVSVLIAPTRVQGEGAADEIARAIEDINNSQKSCGKIDVLIVGRGGGSIEDLWAFNEEVVARAIYNSKLPVISAVGHERDYTIADFAADVRAATPSIAAEIVIKKEEEIVSAVESSLSFIRNYIKQKLEEHEQRLDETVYGLGLCIKHCFQNTVYAFKDLANRMRLLNPRNLLTQNIRQVENFKSILSIKINHILRSRRESAVNYIHRLSALNPLAVLSRGFSLSFKLDTGKIIRDIGGLKPGDRIKTRISKGSFISKVEAVDTVKNKNKG